MVISEDETKLGLATGIVEADETAIGKRKYNGGKRQRSSGVQCVQTILEVDEKANGPYGGQQREGHHAGHYYQRCSARIGGANRFVRILCQPG